MPPKSRNALEVQPPAKSSRSSSRSPRPKNRKEAPPQTLSYGSDGVKDYNIFNLPTSDYKLLVLVTLIAAAVRLFRIYQPTSVVFDEVHFGGFASKYIKGRFFMDVHPPLAKLLITLAGWLAGFNGDFDFKEIGKDYLEPGVPYVAMRMLPAILGVLTVSLMFLTLKASGCRTSTAVLGAGVVIFENALVTQSRLILLDSPLVFFTALTAMSFTSFTNQQELGPSHAFRGPWWFWLVASGVCLGATLSVKWVGLFTVAWVGSLTILQLWVLLGDTKNVTPRLWFKHFFARFFCLIIIPLGFYCGMFAIHFLCLVNPGEGDGFMSSEFQATLNSKAMQAVPADVVFGSRISIRHHNTQGGYLHSHNHMYPTGSKQQQVTLYPHKDENNIFIAENQTQPLGPDGEIEGPLAWDNITTEYIEDGAVIRLNHLMTRRRIHSHDERPPVTDVDWQFEVSAYGFDGFAGDANDMFRVEIVKSMSEGEEAKKRLRTIQSKFKLVHVMTGCVLFSHKVKLPDWGWEQQEVTCAKGGTLPNSVWYIESNSHPMLPEDAEKVTYRNPGFLGKFWELQKVMWTTNAGLTESHAWDSRPPSWPTLLRGINFWGRDHRQIYLLGNPLIWWSSTLAIGIYVLFKGISILRWQRNCGDYRNVNFKRFDYEVGTSVLGWAFHYFPFYLMARQLFLHHYLPALYFAIITLCQEFDFFANRIQSLGLPSKPAIGKALAGIFLAMSIFTFTLYSPLVYGNPWTQDACRKVKLLDTWDFDCNTFHTDLGQYVTRFSSTNGAVPTAQAAPSEAPVAPPPQQNERVLQEEVQDASVTPEPEPRRAKARVEYRDQDGNVLDEALVAALAKEGKVSFETRHETRTLLANGHEVEMVNGQVAPPHPDVEGQNPETLGKQEQQAVDDGPASATGGSSVGEPNSPEAKPASEGNEATN
ncbi:Dolichyl-phosphate-mannose-protein mannosyltransferase-domain-containing protein [Aspergillus alliaceus]|uniref:Dolichyl-phosphate-mannose--protein mannosyltransferase n=1 Tax=Petromyces alliaceus TaxID=209559 RepID=A0A5N6G3F6_PETAA|nr:Dolichyl-phosphate-mannose-protein mannosyltransferase-domain-containing protein [Aspergillus alliaceus]KAB8236802.1 Dolichyl-phosphate-mannose-protein mannosyltransferase-domain-containing protein [Aspergillus alliaceus]KAE8395327.1 Dolichyl-phosphate-mannose-protein mannosyltransferase-domain-containing protein [Aspergillus alliaceus]